MKTRRRIVQALLLLGFLYVLLKTVHPLKNEVPELYISLSPLLSTVLLIMGKFTGVFAAGLVILLLSVFMGRFFCGWICPMGTTIDLGEKIIGSEKNGKGQKKFAYIKYVLLIFTFISALAGALAAPWIDPVTLVYRFYTYSIYPLIIRLWRLLQGFLFRWIPAVDNISLGSPDTVYRGGVLFFAIFAVLVLLGRYYRRFWCRNLCPLGALLALTSRFSLFQKKVSDACIDCGKCTRECKMGAIPEEPRDFIKTECIYCFDCVKTCPVNAVSFKIEKPSDLNLIWTNIKNFFKGKKQVPQNLTSGFSRRNFVEGAVAGLAFATLAKTDYGKVNKYKHLIRPPASMPEDDFNAACIRCGACMKVCMTGGLQPTYLESGIAGMMTPRLIPEVGQCEYECNLCSRTCPTGAIQPFEIEQKPHIKMGQARINRSTCLVWAKGEHCLVCDEYCPFKAIELIEIDGRLHPRVNQKKCVGCGYCEHECPIGPEAAIRVYTQGETRHLLKPGETWEKVNPLPKETEEKPFDGYEGETEGGSQQDGYPY